jgi:hypothetical protein
MAKGVNTIFVGFTIPKSIYNQIEETRKDVSRSRFILRMVEKGLAKCQNQTEMETVDK